MILPFRYTSVPLYDGFNYKMVEDVEELEELEELEVSRQSVIHAAPPGGVSPVRAAAPRPPAAARPASSRPLPQAAPHAQSGYTAYTPLAPVSGASARNGAPPQSTGGGIRGFLSELAAVHYNSVFSVLFIDGAFRIVYSNPQAQKFFAGYLKMGNYAFFDLFGKYLTFDDVRGIRAAVLNGADGYSWRGKAEIRSRNHPKVFTRVYILPANNGIKTPPTHWTVIFDDVTGEHRTLLRSVFISLLEASKLKDNDTGKHISRVNYYAAALAERLFNRPGYHEVDAEFIDNIGFLAAMHDVGKIGTPDDVLNKQGPLSDWEWSVMKEHTKNGAFILSTYPNPMAKEIAQSHHEKWNGTGYPFGIDGANIPLAARIVSIADVYDALRMKRSYKPSFTHEVAMEKLSESKGTQFDPELIDIVLEMGGEFNDIYENNKDIEAGAKPA